MSDAIDSAPSRGPAAISTDLFAAAQVLRSGGLVAFATETVYGLGADAFNPRAVARVFEAKRRPHFDPLIVHLADASQTADVVAEWPETAQRLADAFWPGPLTLVLRKRESVPDLVTSGLPNVAVRVPDHDQARRLIRAAGRPLAAPSANLFGKISPTTAGHVVDQLADRIDLVLDGGPCRVGVESTVVDLTGAEPRLLRPGGLPLEDLQAVLKRPIEHRPASIADGVAAAAPGMLTQHYAPSKPLVLVDDWTQAAPDPSWGALAFDAPPHPGFHSIELLSPRGDLREAAAGFFAALRRLDDSSAAGIIAIRFPSCGLGAALNDRLQRAAAR